MTETEIYSRTLMQQAIKKKISLEIFGLVEELHSLDNKKFISDRQIAEWAIHLLYDDYRNGVINPSLLSSKEKSIRNNKRIVKVNVDATNENIKDFLNCCKDIKYKCMFKLMSECGLRISEVLALQVDDINLKQGFIRINNTSKQQRIVPFLKNSGKLRELIIHLSLRRKNGYLFAHPNDNENRPYKMRTVEIFFVKYKNMANLQEAINTFSFRRRYAINLIEKGIDLETIRQLLGHKTLSATKNFIGEDFVNSHLKTMNEAAIKDRLENNRKVLPCFN